VGGAQRYNWVARFTLMRVFGRDPEKNSLVANDAWHILWKLCFAGRRSSSSCAPGRPTCTASTASRPSTACS
jgi:hypothetical protein